MNKIASVINSKIRNIRILWEGILRTIQKKRCDWQQYPLLEKGTVLFFWTILQKIMWKKYPDKVLKSLELNRHSISENKPLLDLIFKMQYAPGYNSALLTFREMCNIYLLVKKSQKIEGDLAEVGVYRGGSAKIICEAKGEKSLHLFDTFDGLPITDKSIDILSEGEMKNTSLDDVKDSFKKYSNVYYYKGIFPKTTEAIKNKKFSFVNFDTDLYQGTKDCLEFFYPRMNVGGIILSHDYNCPLTPGVKKAFNEFFSNKPEIVIDIWDSQCMVVKQ